MMTPEEKAAILRALARMEAEYAEVLDRRRQMRSELREVDRRADRFERHLTALREIVADFADDAVNGTVTFIGRAGPEERASFVGVPRVQAIAMILAEASPRELHRHEIWQRLRQRGLPNEQLADTSAALAYLKRIGRATNPARGYWRAA